MSIAVATASERLAGVCMNAASQGYRIVFLKPKEKLPIGENWGNRTTLDEDAIILRCEKHPQANLGVLLGRYPDGDILPGVIDIEFDTDQGRATAAEVFRDGVVTPTYKSTRSVHRLFRWDDRFPSVQKLDIDGLEVRLGGDNKQTQSVIPPSIHPEGPRYEWLPGLSFDECELAEVPEHLARRIRSRNRRRLIDLLDDDTVDRTTRCSEAASINREPLSDAEIRFVRFMLGKLTSTHADDYETWFRVGLALKTIGGGLFLEDWLAFTSKATRVRERSRYTRANALAKWQRDFTPNGTASIHTIERIVFGRSLPDDACVMPYFYSDESLNSSMDGGFQ